jgi:putative addiction module antidote
MYKTAVRKVGNSLGITLPKTLVVNLRLHEGEELNLVETAEGVLLTPYNPEFGKWVEAYEKTNRKYKNTLRALSG